MWMAWHQTQTGIVTLMIDWLIIFIVVISDNVQVKEREHEKTQHIQQKYTKT